MVIFLPSFTASARPEIRHGTDSSRKQELHLKAERPARAEPRRCRITMGLQRGIYRLPGDLEDLADAAALQSAVMIGALEIYQPPGRL